MVTDREVSVTAGAQVARLYHGLTWMVCPAAVRTEMAAFCMAGQGTGAIACTVWSLLLQTVDSEPAAATGLACRTCEHRGVGHTLVHLEALHSFKQGMTHSFQASIKP